MSSKAPLSWSDTMADSRSSRRPSDLRLVRWPPFLSACVRFATCTALQHCHPNTPAASVRHSNLVRSCSEVRK